MKYVYLLLFSLVTLQNANADNPALIDAYLHFMPATFGSNTQIRVNNNGSQIQATSRLQSNAYEFTYTNKHGGLESSLLNHFRVSGRSQKSSLENEEDVLENLANLPEHGGNKRVADIQKATGLTSDEIKELSQLLYSHALFWAIFIDLLDDAVFVTIRLGATDVSNWDLNPATHPHITFGFPSNTFAGAIREVLATDIDALIENNSRSAPTAVAPAAPIAAPLLIVAAPNAPAQDVDRVTQYIKDLGLGNRDNLCPICFSEIGENESVVVPQEAAEVLAPGAQPTAPCNNLYHHICIQQWQERENERDEEQRGNGPRCPTCRGTMLPSSIVPFTVSSQL